MSSKQITTRGQPGRSRFVIPERVERPCCERRGDDMRRLVGGIRTVVGPADVGTSVCIEVEAVVITAAVVLEGDKPGAHPWMGQLAVPGDDSDDVEVCRHTSA